MRVSLGRHHYQESEHQLTERVDATVQLSGRILAPMAVLQGQLEVWFIETWAPDWCENAKGQAMIPDDHGARRLEIVFAQAMVESYLIEWVRDQVPGVGINRLGEYFPANDRRKPISQRWKRTIKRLHKEGHIPSAPSFGTKRWAAFRDLVNLRNGLLHARSSRPGKSNQPLDEQPLPTKSALAKLKAGWALQTAATVIHDLHEAVGTSPPSWL